MGDPSDTDMHSPGIAIPELEDAVLVRIKPGEALAVHVSDNITREAANELKDRIRIALRMPDLPIVILSNGLDISVIKNES